MYKGNELKEEYMKYLEGKSWDMDTLWDWLTRKINSVSVPAETQVMPKINGQCNTCKKEIENITDHEKFYYKTQTGNFKMVICCFDCQLQLTNSES